MTIRKRTKAGVLALFGVGLVGVLNLTNSVVDLLDDSFKAEREDELLAELLLAKSNLESELFRDVFLVDSLATIFNIDPVEAVVNFDEIGQHLLQKSDNIRNVGIAPNDVIERVIPLKHNEKAVGLDFRTIPKQYATVQKAREREDIFLSGPVELIQGGRALIARIPIFNDYPVNLDYWGTVSVVIDYDKLMKKAGLLGIKNTKIALRGIDGTGEFGDVFEGNEALFNEADYNGKLIIPNGEWWVAADFSPQLTPQQKLFLELVLGGLIVVYILLFGLITLLWAFYRTERRQANEDSLTHLANRRFMLGYLSRRFASKKTNDQFCLLAIDLNHFKEINDNFGHAIGDEVLQAVARRLQSAVRGADEVARMGGDEFLVVLNRIKDPGKLERIVTKIRNTVELDMIVIDGIPIQPSISIGVACSSERENSIERLLTLADLRMYEDKTAIKRGK
ncbi:diguanylate cyclase [Pseudidiomarina homiensis]|uniref:diguanylate cyclase n=1 Tax=Pseudidiomarina homiensis TaxID=364198 RepID=UPI000F85D4A7|nr:diguanylate cyclase [Pseudidiomarina homiensis]